MYPFINIGPFAIPSKPMTIILGVYLALYFLEWWANREREDAQAVYHIASQSIIAGFVGAKLWFAVENWDAFQDNLIGIVWPITVGYHLIAGVLIFIATALYLAIRNNQSPLRMADLFAPFLLILLLAFTIADWLGGPGFGAPTTRWGLGRHPIWLYEPTVIAIAFITYFRIRKPAQADGFLFWLTAAAASAGYLIVIPFRGNSWLLADRWYAWQIIAFLVMSVSLGWLALRPSDIPQASSQEA